MTSGVVEGSLGRKTKAFQQIQIQKVRYVEPSQTAVLTGPQATVSGDLV